jgi:hypothetical protein
VIVIGCGIRRIAAFMKRIAFALLCAVALGASQNFAKDL